MSVFLVQTVVDEWIEKEGYAPYIKQIIAYHDELQFEVMGKNHAHTMNLVAELRDITEALAIQVGAKLGCAVPIEAESKEGKTWADCH